MASQVVTGQDLPPGSGQAISFVAPPRAFEPVSKAILAQQESTPLGPGNVSSLYSRVVTGTPRPTSIIQSEPLPSYPGSAIISHGFAEPSVSRAGVIARSGEEIPLYSGKVTTFSGTPQPSVFQGSRPSIVARQESQPLHPGWTFSAQTPNLFPKPTQTILASTESTPMYAGMAIYPAQYPQRPAIRLPASVIATNEPLAPYAGMVAISRTNVQEVRIVPTVMVSTSPLPTDSGSVLSAFTRRIQEPRTTPSYLVVQESRTLDAGWAYSAQTRLPPFPPRPQSYIITSEPLIYQGAVISARGPTIFPFPPPPPPYIGLLTAILSIDPQVTALFTVENSPYDYEENE